jgi:dTDP-4-dehydrorhamnose 3,5-epimerase
MRGLHTRVAPGESKIISCTRGAIADVVVDLRPWSASFLKHQWFDLSERQPDQLVLPPGVAHGFQVLSDEADINYLIDRPHRSADERVVHHRDPSLDLEWPEPISVVSGRDQDAPYLDEIRDQLPMWFPKEAQPCAQ